MLPRDFFSVSDVRNEETVEAITDDTVLACYPGGHVEQTAAADPQFARELREVMFQSLARSQDQLLVRHDRS
jgi:CRP/FNR family nitrogen fixation transcriptional regulator